MHQSLKKVREVTEFPLFNSVLILCINIELNKECYGAILFSVGLFVTS